MTKAKKFSNKKKDIIKRRMITLLPIIILSSIPLFKLVNIFLLRIEYCEALFAGNKILADTIFNERISMNGFLYNLPTFGKAIVCIILFAIWASSLYILISPIERKRS